MVTYSRKKYCVIMIKYTGQQMRHCGYNIPIVIDRSILEYIRLFGEQWYLSDYTSSGVVTCVFNRGGTKYTIRMHDIIMFWSEHQDIAIEMFIDSYLLYRSRKRRRIMHINRWGLDNRVENLTYERANIKKKKRTIKLSADISPDDIPTYVWYSKANKTHGDFFTIQICDFKWKTTSSKKVPLWRKLEQAKSKMRDIINDNPDFVSNLSMNGGYARDGMELLKSFYKIISKIKTLSVNKLMPNDKTVELLRDAPGKK